MARDIIDLREIQRRLAMAARNQIIDRRLFHHVKRHPKQDCRVIFCQEQIYGLAEGCDDVKMIAGVVMKD